MVSGDAAKLRTEKYALILTVTPQRCARNLEPPILHEDEI